MPKDNRGALGSVSNPIITLRIPSRTATGFSVPSRGAVTVGNPAAFSGDAQDDVIDYVEGVFDNRPDKPGQSVARKKTFEAPLELLLPGRYVKSISELVGGGDLPPLVHRVDGGRGTGSSERESLEQQRAQRAKEQADAERAKNPPRLPPGVLVKVVPRFGYSAPEAIALGAYGRGIIITLRGHKSDGRALELSALASRVLAPGQYSPSISKSATGHAIVNKLGLLSRRRIVGANVGRGNAAFGVGEEIDVAGLVNIEGVDP